MTFWGYRDPLSVCEVYVVYSNWNLSLSFFVKNFGTSRIDIYTGFGQFLCSCNPMEGNVSISYWKLYQRPLIWAVVEHPSINSSRDTAVWIFWKILGYEKNFHIFAFFMLKMASYSKSIYFIGSKWHISNLVRGLWSFFWRKIAKICRQIKIFEKSFLKDLEDRSGM